MDTSTYSFDFNIDDDYLGYDADEPPLFTQGNISSVRKIYSNGLSKFADKVSVDIVRDIKKCHKLWNSFSKMNSIFDTWEFRYSFYLKKDINPYFLTLRKGENVVALLPLHYSPEKQNYQWFGTSWQEDNTFFAKNQYYIPLLLLLAPRPIQLDAILVDSVKDIKSHINFKDDLPKFILPLKDFDCFDSYLASLKKKKRYNIKRDRKLVESYNPQVYVNRYEDYDTWIKMCNKRFTQKGEISDFEENPKFIHYFKQIIENGKDVYQNRILSVDIDNKLVASDVNVIFKNIYYPLHGGGYDIKDYPGVGNYMNILEIQDAIDMGMEYIDFLQIDYGWKSSWFPATPLYIFEETK